MKWDKEDIKWLVEMLYKFAKLALIAYMFYRGEDVTKLVLGRLSPQSGSSFASPIGGLPDFHRKTSETP